MAQLRGHDHDKGGERKPFPPGSLQDALQGSGLVSGGAGKTRTEAELAAVGIVGGRDMATGVRILDVDAGALPADPASWIPTRGAVVRVARYGGGGESSTITVTEYGVVTEVIPHHQAPEEGALAYYGATVTITTRRGLEVAPEHWEAVQLLASAIDPVVGDDVAVPGRIGMVTRALAAKLRQEEVAPAAPVGPVTLGPWDKVIPAPVPAPPARAGDVFLIPYEEDEAPDWGMVVRAYTGPGYAVGTELDVLMATVRGEALQEGERRVMRTPITAGHLLSGALMSQVLVEALTLATDAKRAEEGGA